MSRALAIAAIVAALPLAGCARNDHAQVWQTLPVGGDASFGSICFADERHGWMAGGHWDIKGGVIGRTLDGGRTWRFESGLLDEGSHGFAGVHFADSLTGCVVAGGGEIFRSDDGGASWRLVRSAGRGSLNSLYFVDRDWGWAAGSAGVFRTHDGGETWERPRDRGPGGKPPTGDAIFFLDRQRGWLAGYSYLMRTQNGGETWEYVTLPLEKGETPRLRGIHFATAQHGWVVGENGTILATTNGGWTWVRQSNGVPVPPPRRPHVVRRQHGLDTLPDIEGPPCGLFLTAVQFLDASRGWTVGFFPEEGRSVVLHTEDGGATWAEEAHAPGEALHALYVTADGQAWSVGDRVRTGPQTLLRRSPIER